MNSLICPEIFNAKVTAFFTHKSLGADTEKISALLSVSKKSFYLPVQKHTDNVVILNSESVPAIADAVVTAKKGLFIGIQVADCVPILICDHRKMVIAAVHAGWRGTAARIISKTIGTMVEHFGSVPEDIVIACGPSIRGCCYHVGPEVCDDICSATGEGTYHSHKNGTYCVDLCTANMYQALSAGIQKENIWISDDCTFCNPKKYHSFRYHKNHAGRQAGFIGIF
jgi:polyphenol oxidase